MWRRREEGIHLLRRTVHLNVPKMREKLRSIIRQGWVTEIIGCKRSVK